MSEKTVCVLRRNPREVVRFSVGEFKGKRFADIRVCISEDGQDATPTKKGLTISPDLWPAFREAVGKLEEALIRAGLLDKADLSPPF